MGEGVDGFGVPAGVPGAAIGPGLFAAFQFLPWKTCGRRCGQSRILPSGVRGRTFAPNMKKSRLKCRKGVGMASRTARHRVVLPALLAPLMRIREAGIRGSMGGSPGGGICRVAQRPSCHVVNCVQPVNTLSFHACCTGFM